MADVSPLKRFLTWFERPRNLVIFVLVVLISREYYLYLNSPKYLSQVLERNTIEYIFNRDQDILSKSPNATTPFEAFNRDSWEVHRVNRTLNDSYELAFTYMRDQVFNPDDLYEGERDVTIPRLNCRPNQIIYRSTLPYNYLHFDREYPYDKGLVPKEFFELSNQLIPKNSTLYQDFVDKYDIGIVTNARYGSKLIIDYTVSDPVIQEKLAQSRDQVKAWVGIGLIDDLKLYQGTYLRGCGAIREIREILPYAKLLNFQVMGPAYPGNVLGWLDLCRNSTEVHLIKLIVRTFDCILDLDHPRHEVNPYANIRNYLNELYKQKLTANLPICTADMLP